VGGELFSAQTNTTSPNCVAPQWQVDDADTDDDHPVPHLPVMLLTSLPDITIVYQLKKKREIAHNLNNQ